AWIEPRSHGDETREAAGEQRRGDQQRERKAYLESDQRLPRGAAAPRPYRVRTPEVVRRAAAASLQRRSRAYQSRCDEGGRQSKSDESRAERSTLRAEQIGRCQSGNQVRPP